MVWLSQDMSILVAIICGAVAVGFLALVFGFVISRAVMQRLGWWGDN